MQLGSASLTIVTVIAVVAILALVVAVVLRRQVLAAGEGTPRMQEIALAIQEGASAYLNRQFRTLLLFAVIVFGLLFLLPGDAGVRVGRSVAFLFGAGFSAAIGYLGMWLAVRANLRVAASAQVAGTSPGCIGSICLIAGLPVAAFLATAFFVAVALALGVVCATAD